MLCNRIIGFRQRIVQSKKKDMIEEENVLREKWEGG